MDKTLVDLMYKRVSTFKLVDLHDKKGKMIHTIDLDDDFGHEQLCFLCDDGTMYVISDNYIEQPVDKVGVYE